MKKTFLLSLVLFFSVLYSYSQSHLSLSSPDRDLTCNIYLGDTLSYSISFKGNIVMLKSPLFMILDDNRTIGISPEVRNCKRRSVDTTVKSPFYKESEISDKYNELVLNFKNRWCIEFRAYDDGIAYRFVNGNDINFKVFAEHVEYNLPGDVKTTVPYVASGTDGDFKSQFFNSFENTYTECNVSVLNPERLIFLPMMYKTQHGVNVCITESDLENYPGLYLKGNGNYSLEGIHASYPKRLEQGGHNRLQMLVREREDFIAVVDGIRSFPWRIAVVSDDARDIASSNLSYLLGSPSRVSDISWIKPGKVAWEWWNDWNLDGVDFETGVNNETYKAYIDFASEHGIEYVILDEGWAVNLEADLMQVVKEIDLKHLIDYASSRNVGIILWAGYHAFNRDMENVCRHYYDMGIKGFKVDFMDRDDQEMTSFNYRAAAMCAKYHLILDLHGTSKPAGLNRTYPNVLNFEGVHGLEQMKWRSSSVDQVKYDVYLPFLRQLSGPMDYTQGAMRNATRTNYYPCNNEPMSQGTRCHQLALYVVFDSPLNMLCDSPSSYMREVECTEFISSVPTIWDETRILKAEIGKYIVTARRKGNIWYIGGINDWTPVEFDIDLSFIEGIEDKHVEIFTDGVNAHRIARDYRKKYVERIENSSVKVKLAPGGGFVMKIAK